MYQRKPRGWRKHIDFILLDIACFVIAFILAVITRLGKESLSVRQDYLTLSFLYLVVISLLHIVNNTFSGVLRRGYFKELTGTVVHIFLVEMLVIAYLFLTKQSSDYSRIILMLVAVYYTVFAYIVRVLWKRMLHKKGHLFSRAAVYIVTTRDLAEETVERLLRKEKAEYEIPKNATPIWMLALLPVVLVAVYSAKDRDLEKELERRKRRLSLRYPEFVSKIQLLLGAGVSVRNVFIRLSEDVSLGEELQGELEIVVRDLKNGMPLRDALDRFGKRTANPLYIKFCALMQQNMKKGTEDILVQLSGEVSEAFSLRKMQARQLGEEVGTKLLIPMILMLAVVMAALMIPAFLSFQL